MSQCQPATIHPNGPQSARQFAAQVVPRAKRRPLAATGKLPSCKKRTLWTSLVNSAPSSTEKVRTHGTSTCGDGNVRLVIWKPLPARNAGASAARSDDRRTGSGKRALASPVGAG